MRGKGNSDMVRRAGFLAGAIGVAFGLAVAATPAMADDPSFVSGGIGWYDFDDDKDAADFRLEYRHGDKLLDIVKPWAGVSINSDGGAFTGIGILMDIYFGNRIVVTPSFGPGLYHRGGSKDLGHILEFRSQIEAGWRFDDRSRVSLALSHLSNAGIGDINPGTEIITLYYHHPVGSP